MLPPIPPPSPCQVGTVKLSMPGLTKLVQDDKRSKKAAAKAKAKAAAGGGGGGGGGKGK